MANQEAIELLGLLKDGIVGVCRLLDESMAIIPDVACRIDDADATELAKVYVKLKKAKEALNLLV